MDHLEEKLDKHIAEDNAHFGVINTKLDKLITDVAVIRGQWKLVGAILGVVVGIAGSFLFG